MKYEKKPWAKLYNSKAWAVRRLAQLRAHPLCASCSKVGIVTPASVVHHINPHHGDRALFMDGALESLCKKCHDEHTATVERAGTTPKPRIGLDGWPI